MIEVEATEQAMNYYHSGNVLWMVQWAWILLMPLLFLVTGFSGKLGAFSVRYGKKWIFSVLLYLVIFVTLYQLLNLPLEYYATYLREHEYGLSNQTLGRWLGNYGKWSMVIMLTTLAFTWIFYLLLKASPKRWWIYSSLVSVGIAFIMMFIQPIWIDPLFNDFGPMKDKQLETQILALASRAGIEHGRIFEVDKSQDTNVANAYVVGFGNTERIVIWDTAIRRTTPDQLLFVMGHEMGHYVLSHNWLFLLYFAGISLVISYVTYRVAGALLHCYRRRFGFHHLYDIASFPLLLFVVSFSILLSTPLFNYFSRNLEREADRFGLEITHKNDAATQIFVDAAQDYLANPYPGLIYQFWRSHHPTIGERAAFSMTYKPWETGDSLRYEKYIRKNE